MRANVDTDAIIPRAAVEAPRAPDSARALSTTGASAPTAATNPGVRAEPRAVSRRAILVAGRNFGCGSSREAAVWALDGPGLPLRDRAVLRRHLLQQLLQERTAAGRAARRGIRRSLMQASRRRRAPATTVDLARRDRRARRYRDPLRDRCPPRHLLEGLDEIGLTLQREAEHRRLTAADRAARPWAFREQCQAMKYIRMCPPRRRHRPRGHREAVRVLDWFVASRGAPLAMAETPLARPPGPRAAAPCRTPPGPRSGRRRPAVRRRSGSRDEADPGGGAPQGQPAARCARARPLRQPAARQGLAGTGGVSTYKARTSRAST